MKLLVGTAVLVGVISSCGSGDDGASSGPPSLDDMRGGDLPTAFVLEYGWSQAGLSDRCIQLLMELDVVEPTEAGEVLDRIEEEDGCRFIDLGVRVEVVSGSDGPATDAVYRVAFHPSSDAAATGADLLLELDELLGCEVDRTRTGVDLAGEYQCGPAN